MAQRTKTDEADGRLYLAIGLVGLFAAGLLGFVVMELAANQEFRYVSWEAVGLTTLVAVSAGARIPVRVRATRHAYGALEVAVLIALGIVPAPAAVIYVAIGVLVANLALRRTPIKVTFNVSKDILASGFAAGTYVLITGQLGAAPPALAGALTGAALSYTIIDEVISIPVIALASRTPIRQRFLANWDMRLGAVGAKILLAGIALLVLRQNKQILVAVPLLTLCLQMVYANRVRTRAEREAWQTLAQSTDELNDVDLDGVLRTAVLRAGELFSADEVEVDVQLDGVSYRLVRGNSDGVTYDGNPFEAPSVTGEVSEVRLEGFNPTDPDVGILRLRFRGPVQLSERENYTLRTFASALCTAIRNAAAYTELARLADQHAHDAMHDPLTSLANRRRLQDEGEALLASRPRGITALLLIDLNHFKEINDTLGHSAGDRVLIAVARRLESAAGEEALVARLGGDEFAVLLKGLSAPAVAAHRAQAMLAALTGPIELDVMRISVEASIGIATAPSRGGMVELMRRADIAMYQAKRSGARTSVYVRARDTADIGRLTLGGDLPRAVAEQEITVSFQPIVDLATGEVIAAEALARWHHPDKGDLSPRQFLEAVERSGILPAFADAILDQALVAAAGWLEAGFDLPVAVNVSPRSLLDRRFPASVAARLHTHDVPADRLILELTESLTLSQLEVVDEVLGALRETGIRLALDDFGTGYSSLAMLSRVPVQELKIDREFVNAMETSAEAAAVVRSTVDLGRSLNLTVVAEGVESEHQRRTLWELGCTAGQGHLFARPMSAPRLLATLRRGSGGRPGTLAPPLHDTGTVIRIPTLRRPPSQPQQEHLPHWPA